MNGRYKNFVKKKYLQDNTIWQTGFAEKIVNVVQGQIHAHVQILWKEIPLSVIITRASCEDMHLSVGDTIYVLVKGTDIMLAKSFSGMLSARNKAPGIVRQIIQGMCYQRFL